MQDPRDSSTSTVAGWQAIGDRSPLAIAVMKVSDQLFQYANPRFIHLVAPQIKDPHGLAVADVIPGGLAADIIRILDKVRTSGEGLQQDTILHDDDRAMRFSTRAWLDDAGEFLILTLDPDAVDVAGDGQTQLAREIREVNARLVQAAMREEELAERAEAASRAKSDFLAVVSHELRTPLTAVIGYTDLLQSGMAELNDQAAAWAERIRFSAWHLREIVDDLISTAVEHTDADQTIVEEAAPAVVAEQAVALVEPRAREKGLDLRVFLDGSPPTLRTDTRKLRQVLTNLMFNAVKFTETGFVELSLASTDNGAVFHVRDSGIGIAEHDLERIFDPFVQVDPTSTRKFGGCGLGLGLSRRFARALGGELTVTSTLGSGSTFTLRIPSLVTDAPKTEPERLVRGWSDHNSERRAQRDLLTRTER